MMFSHLNELQLAER